MQDSYRKITLLALPLVALLAYAVCVLLPTHDDWTYLTTPYYGDPFSFERILPAGSYWRPFDALFGSILGLNFHLFPILNHLCIYAGHLCCVVLVFLITRQLGFCSVACYVASIYFFVCPAMLGSVLTVDSLNQIYSNLWGLLATYIYLTRRQIVISLLLIAVAALCKENGLAWAVVPPIISFVLQKLPLRKAALHIGYGVLLAMIYMVVRFLLTNDANEINDEYLTQTPMGRLKDLLTFIGLSWVCVDYVSIVHAPSRNLVFLLVTLVLSTPFMTYLWSAIFCKRISRESAKQLLALLACWVILSLPHLITLFASMHGYASLGMSAIIVGWLANKTVNRRLLLTFFSFYIVSALLTDAHHWQKAYQSGLIGREMAMQVIEQTRREPRHVMVVNMADNLPKYSMFCVIPYDAFGWGLSVEHYSDHKIQPSIDFFEEVEDKSELPKLIHQAGRRGMDAVWIVEKASVTVKELNER